MKSYIGIAKNIEKQNFYMYLLQLSDGIGPIIFKKDWKK